MNAKKIFCFWEPRERMTPYLNLCMRTWAVNIPQHEMILLDHSNLDGYIGAGTFNLSALKKFRLQVQKDAILAAVLSEHGGVFMDADTIVTADISPVVEHLSRAEVVTFDRHLAFVAARPRARLLALWIEKVQERFAWLDKDESRPVPDAWDYLGNSVVEEALTEIAAASRLGGVYNRIRRLEATWPRAARAAWRRLAEPIFFRGVHGKLLRRLDRKKYGFIAEAAFYGRTRMTPREQYIKFWFEEKQDVESVFHAKQRLIGLHHSWTPEWYKSLSEKEVLENDCILSKTLRHILAR
jgi:hypothetical protein